MIVRKTFLLFLWSLPGQNAFVLPTPWHRTSMVSTSRLFTANFDSSDPFQVLGIDPDPSLDKRAIKRAYKRLALKYHPDVVTNKDSSPEEKKRASDRFAKINWAYETLSGRSNNSSTSSSSSTSTASGYTPPHRRQGASSYTSTSGGSTDWRDYIPNYEKDDAAYDTGGDSLGAIFSDMLAGVAGAAAGSGGGVGIFRDFVEFLENNVDGYSGDNTAAELNLLLRTGTLEEIAEEMDDTELVVQQLSSKLDDVSKELTMVEADARMATRYSEKFRLEEKVSELKARKDVVGGYVKKARKRLVALQVRYKELIVGGENDSKAGGRTSWSDSDFSSSSSSRSSYSSTTSEQSQTRPPNDNDEDAWRSEGFGSSGRGRGSSRRRRASRSRSTASSEPASTYSSSTAGRSRSTQSTDSNRSYSTSSASRTSPAQDTLRKEPNSRSDTWVPPHRRSSASSRSAQVEADRRRLRELQIDDEFDRLKKDLGL